MTKNRNDDHRFEIVQRIDPLVYGLDCEMIYTTVGFELARVTVVNDQYETVLDKVNLFQVTNISHNKHIDMRGNYSEYFRFISQKRLSYSLLIASTLEKV